MSYDLALEAYFLTQPILYILSYIFAKKLCLPSHVL